MKIKLLHIFLFLVIYGLFACKKNDVPILKGDIIGKVSLIDEYGNSLQDNSGVQVQLSSETVSEIEMTNVDGHYSFENIPFGNYHINLIRENYIESVLDFRLSHVGGDAPTITDQKMNQIPGYWFAIDSLAYDGFFKLNIYLQAFEVNKPMVNTLKYVHCFFSGSPDVSYENFDYSFIFFPTDYSQTNTYTINWVWWAGYYNFMNDYTGTVYCRVYPQTYFKEMWNLNNLNSPLILPETLGKPSEVFAFTVAEIIRDF